MGCDICKRSMPEVDVFSGVDDEGKRFEQMLCAVCALETVNAIYGLPRETPFAGTRAHVMFLRAVNFLGDAAPDWAKRVAKMPKLSSGTVSRVEGDLLRELMGVTQMVEYQGVEMEDSHVQAHKLAKQCSETVIKTFDAHREPLAEEFGLKEYQVVCGQMEGLAVALACYAQGLFGLTREEYTEFGKSLMGQLDELHQTALKNRKGVFSEDQGPGEDPSPSA